MGAGGSEHSDHSNIKQSDTVIRVFIFGDEQEAVEIPCTLKICLQFSDPHSVDRVLPEAAVDNLQVCNFSSGWRRDVRRDIYNYVYEEEDNFQQKWAHSERRRQAKRRRRSSLVIREDEESAPSSVRAGPRRRSVASARVAVTIGECV